MLAGWCVLLMAAAGEAKPPNMVFMLMDDVSRTTLHCRNGPVL